MRNIRPFNWSDEDYGIIIDIANAVFPDELDLPELLKHRDNARDKSYMLERVILEADGVPVGSCSFGESPWTPVPGKFWTYVQVHPDHQRRGYGKAIYDHVVGLLSEKKPTILDSWTREDKADAVTFLT
ncbi:GNAT family N-acetyltransferase, partial [bacterium]|nr:GNAT family N-acetyltransferase [bacterium]